MPRNIRSANASLSEALQGLRSAESTRGISSGADASIKREGKQRRDPSVIKEEALRPWAGYDAFDGDPSYYAMEASEWLNEQADMMRSVDRGAGHMSYVNPQARQVQDLAAGIARDYNISEKEAMINIQKLVGSRGRELPPSHAVTMGVPSAHADEKVSLGALEMSGFDSPRMLNSGNNMATDLQVDINGQPINIDAQKVISRSGRMNMGALQNVESRVPIDQFFEQLPSNTPVLAALHKLQEASRAMSGGNLRSKSGTTGRSIDVSANEDKLLQSSNSRFNPNPSATYQENEADLRKDGLIWSDRSRQDPGFDEFRGAGPYDASPSQGLYLTDFERMRGVLSDVTLGDLTARGGVHDVELKGRRVSGKRSRLERDARERGNYLSDVKLVLPKRLMTQFQGDLPPLSQEALEAFTRQ